MKTFDILFAADYPSTEYPTIVEVKHVPLDWFPYHGIADDKQDAKEQLLAYIESLVPDEIWEREEKFKGLYTAKAEIIDKGDEIYLQLCRETVNPCKVEWIDEEEKKDDAPGQT